MNGIHDMGGMQGLGPIVYAKDAPVFHEAWEGRVWGLMRSLGPWGRGRPRWGNFRYDLERIPPAEYLRMSYYERWFTMIINRLLRSELITTAELETGKVDPRRPKPSLLPAAPAVNNQNTQVAARFKPGQNVRSRNLHPLGHTRQPRYTRGKHGTIIRDNGVFALQDTDTDGQSLRGRPQRVYTVRFSARELWGDQASSRDSVFVDLWEDYLEHV
jgi:nitrile hydratase